jgi:hypothetical protein
MPVELQAAVLQMETKSTMIRNREILTSKKWYSKIIKQHFRTDCYR